MKESLLFVSICFLCLLCAAQRNTFAFVEWSSTYKLRWADFSIAKKQEVKDGMLGAGSAVSFNYSYYLFHDTIYIDVYASFDKLQSWYDIQDTSDYALRHEQCHFNICELFARKLGHKFASINKIYHYSQSLSILKSTYDSLRVFEEKYQQEFDSETDHALDHSKEIEWESKIENELLQLKDYTENCIFLPIKNEYLNR